MEIDYKEETRSTYLEIDYTEETRSFNSELYSEKCSIVVESASVSNFNPSSFGDSKE